MGFFHKFRIGFWKSSVLALLNTVRFRSEILSPAPDTGPLWVYATDFHFFLYSSWCNYSGKPEQPEPYQHCPPCWLLPDRSHSWHHHSCPGCTFPAGAVHHLQAEAEREGDTHAHRDLHPCYEGHQCRLHHFRYVMFRTPFFSLHLLASCSDLPLKGLKFMYFFLIPWRWHTDKIC